MTSDFGESRGPCGPVSGPDPRRHAPAAARNREPILAVLRAELPAAGTVLEIGAGTGEHAAHFASRLGGDLVWQPTDPEPDNRASINAHAADSGAAKLRPALRLDAAAPVADWPLAAADAILCCNVVHISPWAVSLGLFAGAGALLPAGGPLLLYGPFKRHGRHTADSNAAFDDNLRARDPSWGVRDLDGELAPLAAEHGLELAAVHDMPANNLTAVFRKR